MSADPVARVARQLAYSPLVAINLTSTVIRRSASAPLDRRDRRVCHRTQRLGDIILDKLYMEDRSRQISFERQGADTEYDLYTR
jgi:hypothetical protein